VLFGDRARVATFSFPSEVARFLGFTGVPSGLRMGALAAFVGGSAWLLARRARRGDWIGAAGWAMVGLLLATTWLLPWYVVWLLPLAALAPDRRLRVAALLLAAAVLGGHLATFLPHDAGEM
jgi:hypothetical protein